MGDSTLPVKRPYHDPDAERAVLGACMLGKMEVAERIRAMLPEDNPFWQPRHVAIWNCIRAIMDKGGTPDWLTVNDRMPAFNNEWSTKDRLYVVELYEKAPLTFNSHHVRLVCDYAIARTVVEVGTRISEAGRTVDIDAISGLLAKVRDQINSINTSGGRQAAWHDLLVDGASFTLDLPDVIPRVWGTADGRILWAAGESLMLVGPPGVGKSTIAGQLVAARLGLISEVLGFPVIPGRGRLLYLAADRPAQLARSLARTVGREMWRDTLASRLVVWRGPPPALLTERPTILREMADDAEADTVVLDSLKDVAAGITEDVAAAAYNRARQLYLATGRELLELHHQVKRGPNGSNPTELADVYGNQQVTAGAGSVVLLWGAAGDPTIRLSHLKIPQIEVGPFDVAHDHQAGVSRATQVIDVVAYVLRTPAGMTAAELARVLYGTNNPSKAQVGRAASQLDNLVARGALYAAKGRADDLDVPTYHAAAREGDES